VPLIAAGDEMASTQRILIVEQDRPARDRIGSWFERAGYEVLSCPGPSAPTYICVGAERSSCPLVEGADLVILDLWLRSDAQLLGVSSRKLLEMYLATGKPILAFGHTGELGLRYLEDRLVFMDWPPDRRDLIETADLLLALAR
jgi:CheY-like chemotaxis protein